MARDFHRRHVLGARDCTQLTRNRSNAGDRDAERVMAAQDSGLAGRPAEHGQRR